MTPHTMPLSAAFACLGAAAAIALCAPLACAMDVGFYGGMTIANLGGDADDFSRGIEDVLANQFGGTWDSERESRLGPAVGGFVAFPLRRDLLFQPEFHYVPRGSEFTWTGIVNGFGILAVDGLIEASYLEFPLTVRYRPAALARGAVHPLFLAGPSFGVNLDGTFEVSSGDVSFSEDVPMKGMSVGLVLGGGIEVDMHPAAFLLVEGRCTLGLTDLTDDEDVAAGDLSLTGREVAILAGVGIHIPRRAPQGPPAGTTGSPAGEVPATPPPK